MKDRYEIASEKMKALTNSKRLQIIAGLIENECNVTKIQKKLGLPQSIISQHLRILRYKGIVEGRREGTKICYKVVDKCIMKVVECLKKEIK
ncbi:winged helix-turn-helix transcriptional regulator [candidate division WOR-3 bacterium]|nr:winged helix-turn-helix transcriptional regulator [candidate division WOR-3 bacterium]